MSVQIPPAPIAADASLFPGHYPQTPVRPRRKPRHVSAGNAGPQSSPAEAVPKGLTPPDRLTRKRALSTGRAPISTTPISNLPPPSPLAALSVTRQRPSLHTRPKPRDATSMPEVPGSKTRKRPDVQGQQGRAHTNPLPTTTSYSQIDRQIQARIAQGLDQKETKKRRNLYGYTYMLKVKPESDGPCVFKIGSTENDPRKRINSIKNCCRHAEVEEHPDAVAQSLPFYWVAEKLIQDELKAYRYNFQCFCGQKHAEYFQAPENVVLNSLHRWRLFCEKSPWDEQGRLKPLWVQRLQHRYKYEDKSPGNRSIQAQRLASHWKAFIDPWWVEDLCNDIVDRGRDIFTWRLHFLAIGEAFALAFQLPLHSWAPCWVGLVTFLVFCEFLRFGDMCTTDRITRTLKGGWQKLYVQLDCLNDESHLEEYSVIKTELQPAHEVIKVPDSRSESEDDEGDDSMLQDDSDVEMEDENEQGPAISVDETVELPKNTSNSMKKIELVYISDSDGD